MWNVSESLDLLDESERDGHDGRELRPSTWPPTWPCVWCGGYQRGAATRRRLVLVVIVVEPNENGNENLEACFMKFCSGVMSCHEHGACWALDPRRNIACILSKDGWTFMDVGSMSLPWFNSLDPGRKLEEDDVALLDIEAFCFVGLGQAYNEYDWVRFACFALALLYDIADGECWERLRIRIELESIGTLWKCKIRIGLDCQLLLRWD